MSPAHRGITGFIAEKGPGFSAGRDLNKLGYRGIDTSLLANTNDPGYPETSNLRTAVSGWNFSFPYRCFIPAHSQLFAFLVPTGPWWLTVALLGTGFALQWRYFRRKETLS